jgi:hypothetical protein
MSIGLSSIDTATSSALLLGARVQLLALTSPPPRGILFRGSDIVC